MRVRRIMSMSAVWRNRCSVEV